MTRARGELQSEEEALLGIVRESPEVEAEREKERQERILLRKAFLVAQLQNPMFRAWLMEQLMWMGTFNAPVALTPTGVPDPYSTYFTLGQQQAGWKIWTEMDALSPELASLMRRERYDPEATLREKLKTKPKRKAVIVE